MSIEKKKIIMVVLLISLSLTVVVGLTGCKKKTEPTETKVVSSEVTKQKLCPVMGIPINASLYTEYKGKKVYFCCPGCKDTFEKEPEKYLPKLPQFSN